MDGENMRFFSQYLTEAPEDEETTPEEQPDDGPPDLDNIGTDDPPDLGDIGEEPLDDEPPDIGDDFQDGEQAPSDENQINVDDLGGKVSAILNHQLYQRFLNLLTSIGGQLTSLKNNIDVLYVLTTEVDEIEMSLKKLDENIRIYLKSNFLQENYSKNLLFYNKCINLLSLLNDSFNAKVSKGIKKAE